MEIKGTCGVLVMCLITFSACLNSVPGDNTDGNSDQKEAQDIIRYNNEFVQVDDRNNGYLRDVNTNLSKVVAEIQSSSPHFEISMPYEQPLLNAAEDLSKIPPALSSADQKFFKTNIGLMSTLYNQIKSNYKTLYDYMRAEDYKDDNYRNGKSLVALLDSLGTKYYTVQNIVSNKLGAVADDAERIIMAEHPLKDFIYAMKDDNRTIGRLNNLLDSTSVNYKTYADKAAIEGIQLAVQYQKHSVMTLPDDAQYANQRDAFRRYYTTLNSYLASVKKLMRNAAARKKIDGADLEYLFDQQDALRTYYNDFVG